MIMQEVWTNPIDTGIFTELKKYSMPWDAVADDKTLNSMYYYSHSGQKEVSPLITQVMTGGPLTDEQKTTIGKVVSTMCKSNWGYLYKAFFSEYNPIENYNSTEESTDSRSHTSDHTGTDGTTHTGTDTTAHTGEDTTTDSGTIGTTNSIKDGTEKTVNGIAGFNTQDEFSKDTSSTKTVNQVVQNDEKRNLTGSTKYGKTETNTLDTADNTTYNSTIKETDSGSHSLHRHGNIGVTTSQQMIESEIVLRQKNFFEIVFSDIDRLLTLLIY